MGLPIQVPLCYQNLRLRHQFSEIPEYKTNLESLSYEQSISLYGFLDLIIKDGKPNERPEKTDTAKS